MDLQKNPDGFFGRREERERNWSLGGRERGVWNMRGGVKTGAEVAAGGGWECGSWRVT